ncbi:glycosyltransferase family 4 protein [[Eubacterium] hominis]|uniref:glycosyltransferase family 4 protein n=1 Tax=[Eubacterium] hominis TaxID=2764325 RepID=UPI0022E8FD3C
MKILVVCQYYYPENFQITPICEELASKGNEVTVLTGLPNYPIGIVPNEYKKGKRDEYINNVHVIRCYEVGRKSGIFYLALNYLSFYISASHHILKQNEKFDLVFIYQLSPILMGVPACKYAKKYKLPLFLYCCDLWPESIKMYIRNENNLIFRIFKHISKKVYSSCDEIAVQSYSFISYLSTIHQINEKNIIYLPAFADESYLQMNFESKNDIVDFVFLGNLGIAQNLIAVLESIKLIREKKGFKVHFVGDGTCLKEMKAYVKENNLEDIVEFYGRRPVEEMVKFYTLADVCIVSLKSDNKTGLTLPSKVQGYMAAGKPIIGMIDGDTKKVIKDSKCGICVPAGDIDGFSRAMVYLIDNKNILKELGTNARDYFKKNIERKCL